MGAQPTGRQCSSAGVPTTRPRCCGRLARLRPGLVERAPRPAANNRRCLPAQASSSSCGRSVEAITFSSSLEATPVTLYSGYLREKTPPACLGITQSRGGWTIQAKAWLRQAPSPRPSGLFSLQCHGTRARSVRTASLALQHIARRDGRKGQEGAAPPMPSPGHFSGRKLPSQPALTAARSRA